MSLTSIDIGPTCGPSMAACAQPIQTGTPSRRKAASATSSASTGAGPLRSDGIDRFSTTISDPLRPPLAVPVAKLVPPAGISEPPCRHGRWRPGGRGRPLTKSLAPADRNYHRQAAPPENRTSTAGTVRTTVRPMAGPMLVPIATCGCPRASPSVRTRYVPGASIRKVPTARPERPPRL